jgi:6-phosphogluconolactonase (cycloisomerase 2 family)
MLRTVFSHALTQAFLLAAVAIALAGAFPGRALADDQPTAQPGKLFLPAITTGMQVDAAAAGEPGNVYVMTNETAQNGGNAVAVYRRSASGELAANGTVPTGGIGDRTGLGSQGGLVLSDNGRWLLAVNPGSNDISTFAVQPDGLVRTDLVASGGIRPTSITIHNDLVYVLNAGGSGNIAGFWMKQGKLEPIPGSSKPASSNAAAPAQIQFNAQGTLLVVTERTTNNIVTYPVANGVAGAPIVSPSVGAVPFGFDIDNQNHLIVSEAVGAEEGSGASSYKLESNGSATPISQSVGSGQFAACWLVISKNGQFAYTANAASNTLSSYTIGSDGTLTVLERAVPTDMQPLDMDLSNNGRFLYVIDGRSDTIRGFGVNADGTLTDIGVRTPVVATAVGMAAD